MEVLPKEGDSAALMLRMEVPNKENKKNGQESIEFTYNINTDVPDEVVGEMVSVCVPLLCCLDIKLS